MLYLMIYFMQITSRHGVAYDCAVIDFCVGVLTEMERGIVIIVVQSEIGGVVMRARLETVMIVQVVLERLSLIHI